jgi:recombination protein RecA
MAKTPDPPTSDKVYATKEIMKDFGEFITTGEKILEIKRDYKTISISPAIDLALGGGVKEGSWLMLSGPPKGGKTTTSMQIIANCQALGRKIIYLDIEGRLKEMNFEVPGIDASKVTVIRSEKEPLSAEKFLDIARKLVSLPENEGCVLVIDSISSLIPEKDLDGDINGMTRPGLPKILSDFVKKMGQIVPNQKCLIIMITHMITNTSGYGVGKMADGGVKIQFQSDTRMEIKSVSPWEIGGNKDTKQVIGLKVTWKIIWSSIGSPYKECESWIRFGHGIDKIQEIIMIAGEMGLINVSGSWYNLDYLDTPEAKLEAGLESDAKLNLQGQEKVYNFLSANPKSYEILEKKVKEMIT